MAGFDTSVNTTLQTRKQYAPIQTPQLNQDIAFEKQKEYLQTQARTKQRADNLALAAKVDASGIPPTFARDVQAQTDALLKEAEEGKIDPTSIEFTRRLQNINSTYQTYKSFYTDWKDKYGGADFMANPQQYVVPGGKDGAMVNNSSLVHQGLTDLMFSDKSYSTDELMQGIAAASESMGAMRKVDPETYTRTINNIKNQLPALLEETIGGVGKVDSYNKAIEIISQLPPEKRQILKDQLVRGYGQDLMNLMLYNTGEVTEKSFDDFVNSFIPTGSTEQTIKTDEEKLFQNRLYLQNLAHDQAIELQKMKDASKNELDGTFVEGEATFNLGGYKVDASGAYVKSNDGVQITKTNRYNDPNIKAQITSDRVLDAKTGEPINLPANFKVEGGEFAISSPVTGFRDINKGAGIVANAIFTGRASYVGDGGKVEYVDVIIPAADFVGSKKYSALAQSYVNTAQRMNQGDNGATQSSSSQNNSDGKETIDW